MKQYIWLGDTPLALIDGTTLYYVHPDNLDRPVFMTNASAMTVAWAAKYDPFGVPFAVTVSPVNTQRLPGQWFQLEDGLSYNRHRTYDPTLGRYTQADPLGFVDGPGIYNYAQMKPIQLVDQTGWATPPANAWDPNGPKAPGHPGEHPDWPGDPKGGPNWVPNPNPGRGGSSHGWEDKNGDVWCPTGQGGRAHGGPHWDVQKPGGGYEQKKPNKKPEPQPFTPLPQLPPTSPSPDSSFKPKPEYLFPLLGPVLWWAFS